jgi:hypothetical protein
MPLVLARLSIGGFAALGADAGATSMGNHTIGGRLDGDHVFEVGRNESYHALVRSFFSWAREPTVDNVDMDRWRMGHVQRVESVNL